LSGLLPESKVLTSTDSYQGSTVFTVREPEVEKWEVTCAGSSQPSAGVRAGLIPNQLLSCPAGAERLPSGEVPSYQSLHLCKKDEPESKKPLQTLRP